MIVMISDIHGCFEEFEHLLSKINWDPSSDRLIACGDLIEKGPSSDKVVDFFINNENATSIKGNHDEAVVRFRKHDIKVEEGKQLRNPMKAHEDRVKTVEQLQDRHFDYLDSMPWWLEFEYGERKFLAVHGGLFPGKHPSEMETSVLCRARYIRPFSRGGAPRWKLVHPFTERPSDTFWAEYYNGEFGFAFYGHQPYDGTVKRWDHAMGIDGGCCYGHTLVAAIIHEDNPEIQIEMVKAKKSYAEIWKGERVKR